MAKFLSREFRAPRAFLAFALLSLLGLASLRIFNPRPRSHELVDGMSMVAAKNVVGPPEYELASDERVEWYYHEGGDVVKLVFDAKSERLMFVQGGKGHPFNDRLHGLGSAECKRDLAAPKISLEASREKEIADEKGTAGGPQAGI